MIENSELADSLLKRAREANEDLSTYLMPADEFIPWPWLQEHVIRLADALYATQPHWHRVKGECVNPVPFEVRMMALSLLSSAWTTDIYLRKARDRSRPEMHERWVNWWQILNRAIYAIKTEVETTKDPQAEEAYKGDQAQGKFSRWRHVLNKWWWGH